MGVVFIALLILISSLVWNAGETSKKTNSQELNVVNNYYNKYNYDYQEKTASENVVYKYDNRQHVVYKDKNEYFEGDFSSYGKHEKKKDAFNYIDEYSVYVMNKDNVGKYFQVIFYFWDSSNIDDTESVERYIRAGETKKILLRDVHLERENYEKWSYDVFNQDNGFEESLYESNSRATSFHSVPSISCR